MIHRSLSVYAGLPVLMLALALGCSAGATGAGKSADSVIAARLVTLFGDAANPADARRRAREAGVQTDDHGVRVDIQTQGLRADDRARFEIDGVRVMHFSTQYERVAASVRDLAALRALARLAPVRAIAPEFGRAGQSTKGNPG